MAAHAFPNNPAVPVRPAGTIPYAKFDLSVYNPNRRLVLDSGLGNRSG